MAKTLVFLQEHGLADYDALAEKTKVATKQFNGTSDRIKVIEARLHEITELQKYIGTYKKTLDIYRLYQAGGRKKTFYAEHEPDITAHRAAKKHFDSLGLTKLPSMQNLKTEYATLTVKKKKLYGGYKAAREEMVVLMRAKHNVDQLLSIPEPQQDLSKKDTPVQ